MEDTQTQNTQFEFDGEWKPDPNPLKIGSKNFSQLDNMCYIDGGIEMAEGYSKINTTALTTYYQGKGAIHLRTLYTKPSYVIAQMENADRTASIIVANETAIPSQGNFTGTTLYTPVALTYTQDGLYGKFTHLSSGIGYANGLESCIWGGDEIRCASCIRCTAITGLTPTSPVDYTQAINNYLYSDGNSMVVTGGTHIVLIGSTRPIKAIKVRIASANASTSTLALKEWKAGAWSSVSITADGTTVGGKAFAQDGIITFDSTVSSTEQAIIQETRLYY